MEREQPGALKKQLELHNAGGFFVATRNQLPHDRDEKRTVKREDDAMVMSTSYLSVLQHIVETVTHKLYVARFMFAFAARLTYRAALHDNSKFCAPELMVYARATPRPANVFYGSTQYVENFDKLVLALTHHYKCNSHHPEHYSNGVQGMDLLDVVEMFSDWQAAARMQSGGDLRESIEVNRKRFNLGVELTAVLLNSSVHTPHVKRD